MRPSFWFALYLLTLFLSFLPRSKENSLELSLPFCLSPTEIIFQILPTIPPSSFLDPSQLSFYSFILFSSFLVLLISLPLKTVFQSGTAVF